jgi:1,4-alpha-glucan branching enzyme
LSILSDDPYLKPYLGIIRQRHERALHTERRLTHGRTSLADFASGHEYFGLHRRGRGWVLREWAPNARSIVLVGTFSDWQERPEFALRRLDGPGTWELALPADALRHGDLYKLRLHWDGGEGDRIPAYARRVVQDDRTKIFSAQVWAPDRPYAWKHPAFKRSHPFPLIYESHVGMAQEREGVGTYTEFRETTLRRIARAGYNTIQLMALMEHPYYGSFGYHVSNFFAASSRFGTPEELKALIDEAHGLGLAVIMDMVHSHAVKNEVEGLSRFDGTLYQYFHDGDRGSHLAWDSRCFDYGKIEVLHFLLSNCRFWLDEYRVDGFRFDGITSMLYLHHGLGPAFDSYDRYFDHTIDEDAVCFLTMANKVIHTVRPDAMTIAEDVSGMPGLAAPIEDGGCGFDYRLAMGIPDCWFKLVNDVSDDDWDLGWLWRELNNRRGDEKTISYVESHDQALVGGKTFIFELMDAEMYGSMRVQDSSLTLDRGIALHKMARLVTLAAAAHGYLNFMGNEFGHPEWIDFPRDGNNWSYHYARRQWRLRDDPALKYHFLADFDEAIIRLVGQEALPAAGSPRLLLNRGDDKILAFERGGLFFFLNFHPTRSVTDYPVEVPPGEYELVLDTDEDRYGGHNRLTRGQHYFPVPAVENNVLRHLVRLYLPCRTAVVLRRIEPKKRAAPRPRKGGKRRTEETRPHAG